jgi:hypothetical protein
VLVAVLLHLGVSRALGVVLRLKLICSAANTAGHTKKATLGGMFFVGNSVSNVVAPQLYRATEGESLQSHTGRSD